MIVKAIVTFDPSVIGLSLPLSPEKANTKPINHPATNIAEVVNVNAAGDIDRFVDCIGSSFFSVLSCKSIVQD